MENLEARYNPIREIESVFVRNCSEAEFRTKTRPAPFQPLAKFLFIPKKIDKKTLESLTVFLLRIEAK